MTQSVRHALAAAFALCAGLVPAVAYCPYSSPIAQGGLMENASSGALLLPDPGADVGGLFWQLGYGDPVDGAGIDSGATLSHYPVGPGDADWIRRDLAPASIDWDWFFLGSDGCLSGGAGAGVMVAYILDNDPDGPNYALLAVSGSTSPSPGHDFDRINTGSGPGNEVPLVPLQLVPQVQQTPLDSLTVSVDVEPALASVNAHDDLGGAGPYPDLLDLSGVTSLLHRLAGGGDEVLLPGCVQSGCDGLVLPAGRELCWQGSAAAVGHHVAGTPLCQGGVLDGFACDPDYPGDACPALGGSCVTPPPIPVSMGPAIPGGCVLLAPPVDEDGDGFLAGGDCDDGDPNVYPGAPQVCDHKNNDCLHGAWPALPAAECFSITGLMVSISGADTVLDWAVPAGGADLYRVFRGDDGDLAAGRNTGFLFTSPASNSASFGETLGLGEFAFYVVAGVRGGLQGSLGQDSFGQERTSSEP